MNFIDNDKTLDAIARTLKSKYKCHSAILYGSRARGAATATSDYDVIGICKSGVKTRLAKKQRGFFWDLFVYPEKDLRSLGDQQLVWRDAKVLFQRKGYGDRLVRRLKRLLKKPFKPAPAYEIAVTKAWADKQLARIAAGGVHGLYRRSELQTAAMADYFQIRRLRYWGPKEGLQWLAKNDRTTFTLFERVYRKPTDEGALQALISRVYR